MFAMLTPFLTSFVPYILVIGGVALFYVTKLRSTNKRLALELANLKVAYDAALTALKNYKEAYDKYKTMYEESTAADFKQEKTKTEATKKAETIKGSEGSTITQDDIDKINAAKAKK